MSSVPAPRLEDATLNVAEEIHAEALREHASADITAAENGAMPIKIEARMDRRWYRVRVRNDGSRKVYRTNAELVQLKERAEAKLCGNVTDSNSRRNHDGSDSNKN